MKSAEVKDGSTYFERYIHFNLKVLEMNKICIKNHSEHSPVLIEFC